MSLAAKTWSTARQGGGGKLDGQPPAAGGRWSRPAAATTWPTAACRGTVVEANCSNYMANCSRGTVVETSCSNYMANCSRGKLVEANCSNYMANCSRGTVVEANCSNSMAGQLQQGKGGDQPDTLVLWLQKGADPAWGKDFFLPRRGTTKTESGRGQFCRLRVWIG